MNLSNFGKSCLSDCVKEFIKQKVMCGCSFRKEESDESKQLCFNMITDQLLKLGDSELHIFYSVLRIVFHETWFNDQVLIKQLPISIQKKLSNDTIEVYKANSVACSPNISFTLLLLVEINKLDQQQDSFNIF